MKLDPVFTVKENKLYTIADNSQVDPSTLTFVEIPWTTVELEEESYNEEYLAQLRDNLKNLEAQKKFAVLVPVVNKPLETPEQIELFTNAYNHTARRVKDCESVAGILLPAELLSKDKVFTESFIETLAKKHAQYVYFSKTENAEISKNMPETVVIL